ncbi:MAG: hypothetical protein ACMXYA_01715 [Candidatus Woesearchaeota archaeon]
MKKPDIFGIHTILLAYKEKNYSHLLSYTNVPRYVQNSFFVFDFQIQSTLLTGLFAESEFRVAFAYDNIRLSGSRTQAKTALQTLQIYSKLQKQLYERKTKLVKSELQKNPALKNQLEHCQKKSQCLRN